MLVGPGLIHCATPSIPPDELDKLPEYIGAATASELDMDTATNASENFADLIMFTPLRFEYDFRAARKVQASS